MSADIEQLRSRIAAMPYAQLVGFELSADSEGLLGLLPFTRPLVGNIDLPSLHGGALAALLQLMAAAELMLQLEAASAPRMFGITIQYLSPGRMVDTFTRARLLSRGRRFASVQASAYQIDPEHPIAIATVQCLLVD